MLCRYSRQMLVPCIGLDGQVLLSQSSVLVIGAGGIGSTVLMYLAGDKSNLYRAKSTMND
jgi:molybdopterin/thiamine biosynthesis adenylyltransferase